MRNHFVFALHSRSINIFQFYFLCIVGKSYLTEFIRCHITQKHSIRLTKSNWNSGEKQMLSNNGFHFSSEAMKKNLKSIDNNINPKELLCVIIHKVYNVVLVLVGIIILKRNYRYILSLKMILITVVWWIVNVCNVCKLPARRNEIMNRISYQCS